MGSFFTSVQVQRGELPHDEARLRLAEVITTWLTTQGYRSALEEEPPDREVIIPSGGDWLSIYDSATESQDDRLLAALARSASSALGDAVGVLVHDSDVLTLSLARGGETVDTYNSAPDYFDPVPEAAAQELAGRPEQWSELVEDTENLSEVWRRGAGEAEGILWEMAPLVGWERDRVMIGFNHREEQDGDLRLTFRLTERPHHEARAEGPPRFAPGGHPITVEAAAGDELSIYCSAQSAGGPGVGLAIMAWGPALEEGLITLERAAVVLDSLGQHKRVEVSFETRPDGARLARFPNLPIPAGVPMDAVMRAPAGSQKAAREALFGALLGIQTFGRAAAPGGRALHLGVVPISQRDGIAVHTIGMTISPPTRKPLRWCGRPEANEALRDLSTPDTLFASVSLADSTPHELVAEVLEGWHERIKDLAEDSWQVSKYLKNNRLKSGKLSPRAVPRWKSWKALLEVLRTGEGFSANRATGPWLPGQDPVFTNDGFTCKRAFEWGLRNQHPATHLGLWVDLSSRSQALGDELSPLLVSLLDRLCEAGAAQAMMGRWRWSPAGGTELTPYERACGINGQCATTRGWSRRFLRGLTPTLWLGPELLERVAPSPHAERTPCGRGARLELAEGSTLADLEQALAPILPSEEDWRAANTP